MSIRRSWNALLSHPVSGTGCETSGESSTSPGQNSGCGISGEDGTSPGERLRVHGVGTHPEQLHLDSSSGHRYLDQLHPDSLSGHVALANITHSDDSISYPDTTLAIILNLSNKSNTNFLKNWSFRVKVLTFRFGCSQILKSKSWRWSWSY